MDSEEVLRTLQHIQGCSGTDTWVVDVDFGGDVDTPQSMIGFVFSLFGVFISWRSYLQPIMILSTTEVEYIDVTVAAKEALWLKWHWRWALNRRLSGCIVIVRVHCYLHRTLSTMRG